MAYHIGPSYDPPFPAYTLEFIDDEKPLKQWFMDNPPHPATVVDTRWDNGATIPAHLVPKRVKSNKPKLYDWHQVGSAPLVSDRFRQAFEDEGPGQQQFFPVQVFDRKGSEIEGKWFIFNVPHVVDSIIESQSNLSSANRGLGLWYYSRLAGPWKATMDSKKHADLTAWVELHLPVRFRSDCDAADASRA